MTNDINIELSDEQLAEVTGGKGSTTNIFQGALNLTGQNNFVNGGTNVFSIGGGNHSSNAVGVEGSTNNVGSTSVSLNSLSI